MQTTLSIEGMHCSACVQRLTAAFRSVPGVTDARVTLSPPQAEIESAAPVPLEMLADAARSAGAYSIANGSGVAAARSAPAPAGHADHAAEHRDPAEPSPSLYPLVLIVLYIAGAAALTTYFRSGERAWLTFMNDFMAGFFLVFSFFKLLDLRGFAGVYRTYDLVAGAWPAWGLIYPFVELALGVAYLVRWEPAVTNAATLVLMLVGAIGVLRALLRKNAIRCACLGTALNLPMTTVTLVEDVGMAVMAAAMLIWRH